MLKYEITRTGEKSVTMQIPGGSSLTLPKGASQIVWLNEGQAEACTNTAGFEVVKVETEPPPEPTPPAAPEVIDWPEPDTATKTKKGKKS